MVWEMKLPLASGYDEMFHVLLGTTSFRILGESNLKYAIFLDVIFGYRLLNFRGAKKKGDEDDLAQKSPAWSQNYN